MNEGEVKKNKRRGFMTWRAAIKGNKREITGWARGIRAKNGVAQGFRGHGREGVL